MGWFRVQSAESFRVQVLAQEQALALVQAQEWVLAQDPE